MNYAQTESVTILYGYDSVNNYQAILNSDDYY